MIRGLAAIEVGVLDSLDCLCWRRSSFRYEVFLTVILKVESGRLITGRDM